MSEETKQEAEKMADAIIQALREEGFDAFHGGYYDISKEARPIIIQSIIDFNNKQIETKE